MQPIIGILTAVPLLFSTNAFAGSFVPPQANVILLAGLSGDVESETSYAQQLKGWLDVLTGSNRAAQIIVLSDSPEQVPSQQQNTRVLQASRENFLALPKQLTTPANPLLVIAWGHGGRQGKTPVFHVRGPRLTPEDFKSLAENLPAAQSEWVLMFRGSGAFAPELTGPHREVLASERSSSFNSDPIGARLLLNIARANPSISFDELSVALGRAVASWYAERNLARTEEPALWVGPGEPRLLATDAGETGSSAPAPAGRSAGTNAPTSASAEAPARQPSLAWKGIERVPAGAYPDSDAVILREEVGCTLGSSPAVTTDLEQFIQILTPDGKQFGDFDLTYSAPEEELEIVDCEVLRPDGKLVRMDPDQVAEARTPGVGDYHAGGRKFFSLPGVTPGAILHVHYRTQWRSFPLPHVTLELPLANDAPVIDCAIRVNVPRGAPFHFQFREVSAPDPQVSQTGYSASYLWRVKELPAHKPEALTPPHDDPRILLSTFPDWPAFAQWYGRVSRLTAELTPQLVAKANELTRDARNDREKILALYNFVSGMRYVAIPLGVNSFRPHAAAQVLESGFGDCKDKANLLNALLHVVKIPADLVLVPRFSQAEETLPGMGFNHAISRITSGEQVIWADTTDEVCRFGLLPPGDSGRKVLVIDGKSESLVQLPVPDPKEHLLKIRGQVTCAATGGGWPMTLRAVALGYPDYALREAEREVRSDSRPLLATRFRPVAGAFALKKQSATPASALEQDFTWEAQGQCVGLSARVAQLQVIHAPFWLPQEWDLALNQRQAPLFLNQGYPLTLDEEFELALPVTAQRITLPEQAEGTNAPLRWRVEWTKTSAEKITAHFHAEIIRGELSTGDTAEFQQKLRSLLAALAADAAFLPAD